MAYLFDDASSQRLTRAVIGYIAGSIWFYPDDSGLTCTISADYNAGRTRYRDLRINGATTDTVTWESTDSLSVNSVTSVATVNYNAWNHVYWASGTTSPTHAYISLNGETLVDGGAGSYVTTGTTGVTALGRLGTTVPIQYFSGMMAEAAFWNAAPHDFGDGYKMLAPGFDPRLVPVDPNAAGGAFLLTSYSQLIANVTDLSRGGAPWSLAVPPTVAATHPRIFRQLTE